MKFSFLRFRLGKVKLLLLSLSLTLLVCVVPQLFANKLANKKDKDKAASASTNEQKRAVHALNRLTFGPRPGDIQQVAAMGVDRWIDQQLHPDKISDSAVDARLAPFRTLRMSSKEIIEEFPDNQMIRQIMDGKRSMPSDPAKRAVIQVQIARLQEKQEKKQTKDVAGAPAMAAPAPNLRRPIPPRPRKNLRPLPRPRRNSPADGNEMNPNAMNSGSTNARVRKCSARHRQ